MISSGRNSIFGIFCHVVVPQTIFLSKQVWTKVADRLRDDWRNFFHLHTSQPSLVVQAVEAMSADRGEKMPCVANTFLEKCALIYIVEAEFEIISFSIIVLE